MWLITTTGFFSVVEKPSDREAGTLTVRARVKQDLEDLRDQYLPAMSVIDSSEGTDYPYRATVSRDALAEAVKQIVSAIDYSNFKGSVGRRQGPERAHTYELVWSTLSALEAD